MDESVRLIVPLLAHLSIALLLVARPPSEACGQDLRVTVLDSVSLAPVEGADVALLCSGKVHASGFTNAEGVVTLSVPVDTETGGVSGKGPLLSALYPNPARDHARGVLTVDRDGPVRLALWDLLGRPLASYSGTVGRGTHTVELDLGHLPPGAYFLRADLSARRQQGVQILGTGSAGGAPSISLGGRNEEGRVADVEAPSKSLSTAEECEVHVAAYGYADSTKPVDLAEETEVTLRLSLREEPCPQGMALTGTFCMDRWEATIEDGSPYDVPESGVAATAKGVVPQGYISGDVAEAACLAAGKRLCTSSEWLRACRGPEGTTYPYGNTYKPGACNEGRAVHPILELFGAEANWSAEQMNDPRLNQLEDSLDPTGSHPVCVSAEGVYDLHGNLHEWVADADGTFRGGFYVDARINGPGCLYVTTAHNRSYHDYSTGFRCCAEAQGNHEE